MLGWSSDSQRAIERLETLSDPVRDGLADLLSSSPPKQLLRRFPCRSVTALQLLSHLNQQYKKSERRRAGRALRKLRVEQSKREGRS